MTRNVPVPDLSDEQKARVRSWLVQEDASVLAFDKPSGVPVQTRGGRSESLDFLLWAFARSNGKRPRLVHRIDAETSGVIIAAKTQPAAAFLSAEFAERRVEKTYLALVRGDLLDVQSGMVDAAIGRKVGPDGRDLSVIRPDKDRNAKPARTSWRILARADRVALIEAKPETGRMHQIRVHLAHLGCPILGDPLYGAGQLSAPRCMLHAHKLECAHPDDGVLKLESAVPEDMAGLARALGLVLNGVRA